MEGQERGGEGWKEKKKGRNKREKRKGGKKEGRKRKKLICSMFGIFFR